MPTGFKLTLTSSNIINFGPYNIKQHFLDEHFIYPWLEDDIELSDQAKHEKHSGNNSHCLQTITNATHFFDKKGSINKLA